MKLLRSRRIVRHHLSDGPAADTQGASQAVDAAEESVEELAGAKQDYEAQILKGVEDATDHSGKPVPNRDGQKRRDDGGARSTAGVASN